jgi:hypothetical protein
VPLRKLAVLTAAVLLLPVPGSADAAKRKRKRPALAVTSLIVPAGRQLDPAQPFAMSGRIANRGRRRARPLLSFTLRTRRARRGTAYAIGARSSLTIRRRSARRFRVRVQLPASVPVQAGRRLYVTACVRRRRGARPRCRTARRPIVFTARRSGAPPAFPPATPAAPPATPTTPGGSGGGGQTPAPTPFTGCPDRPALFPTIGNAGYDTQHYDLTIQYQPVGQVLLGETIIESKATQPLTQFSLDFHGLSVSAVEVDGQTATTAREADKLIVTPATAIADGATFTTRITYGGMIAPYTDPDDSHEGWVTTDDGAYVVNEPVGAMSWFPNNNVPTDKALYDITVTVPATSTVMGNGRLVETSTSGTQSTWHWREDRPMASYLVTATNGVFQRTTDTTNPDRPFEYAVDPKVAGGPPASQADLELSPGVLDFYEDTIGAPYPFTSSGGIVDFVPDTAALYALETQTRPNYPTLAPGGSTVAHELAHQWFGDSLSPTTWSDIWLNEGPAEFSSWLWDERVNDAKSTSQQFDDHYADNDWSVPPAAPRDESEIFDTDAMYNRGAMVMEALRQIIGEERYFGLLKTWLEDHKYDDASTTDFVDLIRTQGGVSQTQLDVFFQEWLCTSYPSGGKTKPGITPQNFATYVP